MKCGLIVWIVANISTVKNNFTTTGAQSATLKTLNNYEKPALRKSFSRLFLDHDRSIHFFINSKIFKMSIQNIKQKVKEGFESVDSKEFLEKQIENGVEKHRRNFREYITVNPESNFDEWKGKIEASVNVNTTKNDEIVVIGLFLLALDEFEKRL